MMDLQPQAEELRDDCKIMYCYILNMASDFLIVDHLDLEIAVSIFFVLTFFLLLILVKSYDYKVAELCRNN